MCRFHLFVILLLEQFNFRLSAEDKKAYFDRLLVFVVDNENIDEIEDEITGNIGKLVKAGTMMVTILRLMVPMKK